jgi:NAD(P)H dehydrogenase (quinone)
VTYVPVTPEALQAGMVAGGFPEPVADLVVSFDITIAQGALAVASSTVKDLTGRAPQSVSDFLAERRAALLN